ncbi:MAG: UbiA family prenyltransferase [Akkermansiaceae bacterium]|jgi:hypothetical protein|nr:UbiA family prenyltransferase [Akkermansiaceae bacterium]
MIQARRFALLGASARLANLPSVVCNVWLGLALAGSVVPPPREVIGLSPWLLMLAALACYVGGNLLNDWHDRDWDACHRPERALPRGAFAPGSYLWGGVSSLACGLVLATLAGPSAATVAGMLVLAVLGYTHWHKTHAGAVFLMGLCRGLLPLLAVGGLVATVASEGNQELFAALMAPAVALWFYTSGLSLLARGEAAAGAAADALLPALWPFLGAVLLAGLALWTGASLPLVAGGLAPFLVWTTLALTRFRRAGRPVPALLAGFPLLDWVLLLPFGVSLLGHAGVSTFALVSLLLPPLCFLAGLALQRLWAAT